MVRTNREQVSRKLRSVGALKNAHSRSESAHTESRRFSKLYVSGKDVWTDG